MRRILRVSHEKAEVRSSQEDRIHNEAMVDARSEEQAMSWYYYLGWIIDKFDEPRITLFAALLISGLGLLTAAHVTTTLSLIIFISVAAIGIHSSKVPLWRLPSTFLTGSAVAAGIGCISTIGTGGKLCRTIHDGMGSRCDR